MKPTIKKRIPACFFGGVVLFLMAPVIGGFPFSKKMTAAYAQEGSPPATIGDAKREASQEASRAGEHAENLKESVKRDTTGAGKAVKTGVVSGFRILKEGVRSLFRGEGAKVEKTAREEQNPYDP